VNEFDPGGLVGAVAGAAGALVTGGLWFRKRLSRDTAEVDMLARQSREISRLHADLATAAAEVKRMQEQRTEDASAIARLSAEVGNLRQDNQQLIHQIRKFARALPEEARQFIETDFAPLEREAWKKK